MVFGRDLVSKTILKRSPQLGERDGIRASPFVASAASGTLKPFVRGGNKRYQSLK